MLGVSEVINAFGTRGGGIDFLVYPIPSTNHVFVFFFVFGIVLVLTLSARRLMLGV